jgi:hypothetical protein
VREILSCVVYLVVGGMLAVAPVGDYRVGVVGLLMIAGGLAAMVWKAAQGSRRREDKSIHPGAGEEAGTGI